MVNGKKSCPWWMFCTFFVVSDFISFGLHAVTLAAIDPTLPHDIHSLVCIHDFSLLFHLILHKQPLHDMMNTSCHLIQTESALTTFMWNQGALLHPIRMGFTFKCSLKFDCMIEQCNTKIYLQITTTIVFHSSAQTLSLYQ